MSAVIVIASFVFASIVLVLALFGGAILGALRTRRGGLSQKNRALYDEETRIIQQMHDDLTKMEARLEALETILMEESGKDNK